MQVSRRTLFSVVLAVSLLIGGVSNHQTSTCTPTVNVRQLGRATVAAAGVFEARLETLGGPTSSLSHDGPLNATFSFRKPLKGKFKRVSRGALVVVGLDPAGDSRTMITDVIAGCSVSDLLVLQWNYIVFVDRLERDERSAEHSGVTLFQSTAFPVPATQGAVEQIRRYQCRRCGQCISGLQFVFCYDTMQYLNV